MSLVGAFTRITVVPFVVAGVAASFAVFAASSAMAAPQVVPYEQLLDKARYPARVIAIGFAGYTLQSGSSVKWRAWEARMTDKPVVATLGEVIPGVWYLSVSGLVCTNAVKGERICVMTHTRRPDHPPQCGLTIYEANGTDMDLAATFLIDCPVSLTLDY
jgi:hypothetical protein